MFEKFVAQKTPKGYILVDKDSQMDCNYLKFYEKDRIKIEKFINQLNYLVNVEYALNDIAKTDLFDEDLNDLKNIIIESIFKKIK